MARRKKAWNMSNPLYRYLHGGGRTKTRRVSTMARRGRKSYRRRGGGGFGGSKVFGLSTKGLIGGLGILGLAGGVLFGEQLGAMIPVVNQQDSRVQAAAGGFVLGGPAGAVGAALKSHFMGSSAGVSSATTW